LPHRAAAAALFGAVSAIERVGATTIAIGPAGSGDDVLSHPLVNGEVIVQNLSQSDGSFDASSFSDLALLGTPTIGSPFFPEAFKIIDTTLASVNVTGILPGQRRVLVRFNYSGRQLRTLGIREDSLHVLKRGTVGRRTRQVWYPLPNDPTLIRLRIGARFFSDSAPRRVAGRFGIDRRNRRVWAVFAENGSYALGGVVPEPAAWSLVAGGALLLAGTRRRRGLRKDAP